jgi:chromosome segregation ATPase
MSYRKAKTANISDSDDIPTLKKKIAKITESYKELQKDNNEAEQTLLNLQQELRATRKLSDESKLEADNATKLKSDIEIQYKHIIEVKKEQDLEIKKLETKLAELEEALSNIDESEEKWNKQKNDDIREFDRQKNLIQIQSRFLGRKLEDDRRKLQAQLYESKQELKRNYRREVDQLKQRQDLQLSDFDRESKQVISAEREKYAKKISNLETENYNLRNKIDQINQAITKQTDQIAALEKNLKREAANSEIMGTTSVEWLDKEQRQNFVNEFLTSEEKTLERMLQTIHDKLVAAEEELLLAKRRRNASERQVKELKESLAEQDMQLRRLETSKNDIERRLTKRIEQLEDQILRKNRHTEADLTTQKHKLQDNVSDKDDILIALKKELEELQSRLKYNRDTAAKMSDKVSVKLDVERERFIALEKEKHDLASEILHYTREIGDIKEHISLVEKESVRYKDLIESSKNEKEKLSEKVFNLENSIRRLENAPIKA